MFDLFGAKDPQRALLKANEFIKDDRISSAIKILEDNLTESDDSFDLYLTLARLYFETEERTRAVEILRNAKSVVPSRIDEIIALLSGLFYQHTTIDSADFLIQLYVEQQRYEEISKILRSLGEREIKLLITRYEKLKQIIDNKNVVSKKDFENVIILASSKFFIGESEQALEAIDAMVNVEVYGPQLLNWIKTVARERYSDWRAAVLLLRIQIMNKDYRGAVTTAQRAAELSSDSINSLINIISSAKPPQDLEATYTKFLTDLQIKKGNLNASTELLMDLLKKDIKKADDVIKGLRELERIDPENLNTLYALGDTYVKANRVSLAISVFDKIFEIDQTQHQQVLQRYKAIFKKEPNNPEVIGALIKAYLTKDEINSAIDVIENAYKSDPGLLDEYIINLNTILERDLNKPKALYLLGMCYAHKGDHENAHIIFENLMEKKEFKYVYDAAKVICEERPDDLQYLGLRIKSMIMLGENQKALSLINTYIEHNPDKITAFLPALDMIISKQPKLSKSILPIYEHYKKENPFVAELAMARGYAFSGGYEKSTDIFERLFTEDKEHKDTTKRALIEVIKERPKAVPLLLAAARVFMKDGEVEVATQFFKTAQMVDPKAFFEVVDEFYDALKAFPKDREVRILLIDTFFNRKLWDRVIEESRHAIEVFGQESQYFNLKLGEALVENGNLSDAVRPLMLSLNGPEDYSQEVIKYLDKILHVDKSNVPAHFARGRALSRAHRINEAIEEYLLTVRILPARAEYVYDELKSISSKAMANPMVIFALGSVEFVLKKYEHAIKHLLQSCELDVNLAKKVIPLFEKLIQSASSPLLEFSLAKTYHLAGLRSSAIKYYIKAQADDKAYREPAISEMKKICAENPRDIESRKGLAEIYFNYNNLEDSLDLVNEIYKSDTAENDWAKNFVANILHKNPQHIPSYYFLAYVFLDKKIYKKAVEVYRRLIEMLPTEITKVISILENFFIQDPKVKEKSGELLFYLGGLYKDAGELEKAIKLFNELFTFDVSFSDAIIYQIKEVLKKNADLGEAYLLANKIFMAQKEYERAVEAIKHAKELFPDNEEIILKEGQVYYAMGDPEKAIKLYTELLNKTKDRTAIYRLIKKTREQYFKEKVAMIKGDKDNERLERANIYLLMDKLSMAEKELQFVPENNFSMKQHTLLRARLYLKRSRPIDALEIMKDLPVDEETAPVYADIYEAMGSYEAAAMVLRQTGIEDVKQKILSYEKLAQERRLARGRYFIEGRS